MLSTYTSYRLATRDLDRTLAMKAKEGPVALETKYYLENISEVKSIDDFIKDTRLFKYAMKAFGLEEMSHAKGYMKKILQEGLDDPKSLGNRVDDSRIKEFALTFDFLANGEDTTKTTAARQGVVDKYVRQSLEVDLGEENEAVRLALYFRRSVEGLKTGFSVLADPAVTKVVYTALGYPDEMRGANIDRQAAAIEDRLDLEELKSDPAALDKFLLRFSAMWDAQNATATSPILSLFSNQTNSSVGLDLAITLQQLKRGG